MRIVRVLLLVLAAVVFVAPAASAQGGGGGGRGAGRGMAALMANITLTADQQAKVDSITAKYREQMMAMRGGGPPDSTTMAKMRETTNKQYDEIRGVLTEDQQKVFDENRKNLPTGRRGGGSGR